MIHHGEVRVLDSCIIDPFLVEQWPSAGVVGESCTVHSWDGDRITGGAYPGLGGPGVRVLLRE